MSRTILLALVTAIAVAASACSAVRDIAGIREAPDSRVIVIDKGYATTSRIISLVEPVIEAAAEDGAVIEAWLVTGGVAAAMAPVDLSVANGGDLRPVGKNAQAWTREAEANAVAVLDAVTAAVETLETDGTGADLYGAIAVAATRATELDGGGDRSVVLITGGGVHRDSRNLDMAAIDYGTADPDSIAADVMTAWPVSAPNVDVVVVGAGRFPDAVPTPDARWAQGVRATWEAFCTALDAGTCEVHDKWTESEG